MDKTIRAGIFGIVIVVCVLMVAFGYTKLPFYPQGKSYEAYFADAGGISPGNDVNVSGIVVGKVSGVALAGDVAKVTFTVNRNVMVGDQSLASIKTDTVLVQEHLDVVVRSDQGLPVVEVDAEREWAVAHHAGTPGAPASAAASSSSVSACSRLWGTRMCSDIRCAARSASPRLAARRIARCSATDRWRFPRSVSERIR